MGKRINVRPRQCRWCKSPMRLAPSAVCWRCAAVDQAWAAIPRARMPNMRRAFFRGYLVGAQDPRATGDGLNPYARGGASHGYWQLGHDAGVAHRPR